MIGHYNMYYLCVSAIIRNKMLFNPFEPTLSAENNLESFYEGAIPIFLIDQMWVNSQVEVSGTFICIVNWLEISRIIARKILCNKT